MSKAVDTTRPRPRPRPRRWKVLALSGLAVLATSLSACGESEPASSPFAPTSSPTTAPVTMTKAPADYREVKGEGFVISAPATFQEQQKTSSTGQPMLWLEAPSSVRAIPQRVAVIRDVKPNASAEEQSFALESAHSVGEGKADVSRIAMTTPEGQSAYLIRWTQKRPDSTGSGSLSDVTYWQLMWQVDKELILNVVAFAPSADFETSEVSTILRTFKVSGGSHA